MSTGFLAGDKAELEAYGESVMSIELCLIVPVTLGRPMGQEEEVCRPSFVRSAEWMPHGEYYLWCPVLAVDGV